MPFSPTPIFPGDAFEAAHRFGLMVAEEVARLADPAERAARLARRWEEVASLGWAATLVPEAEGGAGGGLDDLLALADGIGRSAAPLPLAGLCAVVPILLRAAGAAGRDLLTAVAAGAARPCPVLVHGPVPPARADAPLLLEETGGRAVLHGTALGVEAPPGVTHYLVAPDAADGPALLLLPAGAPGLSATRHERVDGRPTVDLDARAAPGGQVLARGDVVAAAVAEALEIGALFTCVECVSAMGAMIEQTVTYLSGRVQFGAPLSTQQALRHRVAEMYVAYENLRGLVAVAAREAASGAWRATALAKLRLGTAGRFVAKQTIQCHGGMGLTEELPATRLARRVLMAEYEYGDRAYQAARLLGAREVA